MAETKDDKKCCTQDDANREGTSLLTRFLPILDPANAPVDPRSTEDILVFAKRYAELVRYYDFDDDVECIETGNESTGTEDLPASGEEKEQEHAVGKQKTLPAKSSSKKKITTWKEFFYNDIAVVVASISQFENRLWHIKKEYNAIRKEIESNPTKENYRELFLSIIHHLKRIHRWYERSVDDHPLKTELGIKIKSFLVPALKKLIAYDKGMLVNTQDDLDLVTQYEGFKDEPWNCDYNKIDLDATIYVGDQLKKKIIYALMYVDDIFNTMYKAYEEITKRSGFYWQQAIEKFPSHQPHMALFIAFVELFSYAKKELNGLTRRHLEFFYRDVLHLKEKPANPDSVCLIYQLAKGVAEFDLKQGTGLTAGKDALGKQLVYKTDKELVINKAKVKELKTIFLDKINPIINIYAAPVANSADGKGEKFKDPETAWSTFGYFEPREPGDKITGDEARIGFAIASPQLLLSGGERKINFKLSGKDNRVIESSLFDIYLTGEKEWILLQQNESAVDEYKYLVPVSEKAIVPFDSKIHPGNFSTQYPIAKFILKKPAARQNSAYNELGGISITNISIDVSVEGLTDIMIENDDGVIDPGKPFYPFTARPVVGSSFYIGAKEFTEKNINEFAVNVDFNGQMDFDRRYTGYVDFAIPGTTTPQDNLTNNKRRDFTQYKADLSIFRNNAWTPDDKPVNLFDDGTGLKSSWKIRKYATVNAGEGLTQILNRGLNEKLTQNSTVSQFKTVLAKLAMNDLDKAIELITKNNGIFVNPATAKAKLKEITTDANNNRTLSDVFKDSTSGTGALAGDPLVTKEKGILYALFHTPEAVAANNYKIFGLTLKDPDFGHEFYPTLIALYLSKKKTINIKAGGTTPASAPAIYNIDNAGANDVFVPSTPAEVKIKSISIDYSASETLSIDNSHFFHIYPFGEAEIFYEPDKDFPATFDETIFHKLLKKEKETNQLIIPTTYLLPQFKFGSKPEGIEKLKILNSQVINRHKEFVSKHYFQLNQYISVEQQQGNLYIGIENLTPPQNLSLLFKLADGTAYDNDSEPPKINWSYLVNNEWLHLPQDHVISDSTYGFQTTGIILIDFPADATSNNTILTTGLHWLCASIDKDGHKIPKLIDVIAQANQASFSDQQNDPAHYKNPLPKKTISKPLVKIPEVKLIDQPFESFDGKPSEEGNQFYQRVSERLRHKGRAITPWDYEHLVLEQFPSVYKVKILSHTDPECLCRHQHADIPPKRDDCCCPQSAPGHVLVVPISNVRNKNAIDPLKPRTGRRTLLKIEEFLKKRVSPFVHVHAKNPKFEEVKVSFNVKFYTGIDKGFYKRKLNDDLIQYLTPWAYDSNFEILFGNKIYASKIINFIEELDYVDYISCFRMIHIMEGCCDDDSLEDLDCDEMRTDLGKLKDLIQKEKDLIEKGKNLEGPEKVEKEFLEKLQKRFLNEVSATSSQAILVSAKQHCIDLIEDEPSTDECNCKGNNTKKK